MSLINQMLQDLEARSRDGMRHEPVRSEIRSVPDSDGIHPAWWVAAVLAMALVCAGAWFWMHRAALTANVPSTQPAQLALKSDGDLNATSPAASVPATVKRATVAVKSLAAAVPQENIPPAQKPKPLAVLPPDADESVVSAEPIETVHAKHEHGKSTAPIAVVPPSESAATPDMSKKVNELSPQQHAENEYRKAASLMQQSKSAEAIAALEQALSFEPKHAAARQMLVGVLHESGRTDEAIAKAHEGLNLDAAQVNLAMILARLEVDRNQLPAALETMQQSLPYAADRADYQAFFAALLQRAGRHRDAIARYLVAVSRSPQNAVWWMGLGISLQAENRVNEAQEAFGRAKGAGTLSPELQAFVEQRLGELQH